MHSYATDSTERKSIPFFIAALGILAAWLLGLIIQKTQISIPWCTSSDWFLRIILQDF